ncbi:two-component system sensor histidine kinase YesM [Neobacillus niacini]|uniref:sensor histidine kinase n=1 Tax=Neobacillus niacini TaxID=86668 RepID=UPI002861E3B2|nr:sensor histidine kinase [Neobacillus niacini]MDR7076955.1 two-component system sensor histidine kinase YesM [Neobacillus niacini]
MQSRWKKLDEFFERYILLKNQSLMTKLCIFSSFLVIFPVLSVAIISYARSSVELENELRQYSGQIIDQVESHVEYYLQEFEITSLKIINSPDVSSLLKNEKSVNVVEGARNTLKDAAYSRADISNITVLVDDDIVIDTLGVRNFYPSPNIKQEYWYSSVPLNGMTMLVTRTLKLKNKEQPVISLVRRLYNPDTLLPVGMLIIDINFRRIEEISNKVTISRNGYFFILDANGHYVYHPDYSKLGTKIEYNQLTKLKTNENSTQILENERKDFVTYTYSPNIGWSFFTAVPYKDITGGIIQIGRTIILTILISLIIAYTIGFFFATSIIRPIRRLKRFMKEVEIGNLSGRVLVESNDEIGQLSAGFNNTVEKLSNLLEEVYISKLRETEMSLKQKEIEIKMLQSQMNPHFLYNSLETIRGMALEENQENIAIMSFSLAKLLRYNLKNDSSTVSLGEEIKFCQTYLQIQKFRFEERFEYEIDIPEWAIQQQVVKFSLQPLVENCFVHAYGQFSQKFRITISVVLDSESSFTIRIEDTGTGIPNHILDELTRKIEQKTTNSDGKHIGILNVQQRIHHVFGSEFGLTIRSQLGAGTVVEMHLPIKENSDVGEMK